MTVRSKPRGHPAKQDQDIARLYKTSVAAVELVRGLGDKLDPDTHLHLRSAALGLMETYARITGATSPIDILGGTNVAP